MPRVRRKRIKVIESDSDDSNDFVTRRSSLRVNLSYTSNLSDSGHGSLRKPIAEGDETSEEQNESLLRTVKKRNVQSIISNDTATPASVANVTVINAAECEIPNDKPSNSVNDSLSVIKAKEQQLNKSCSKLKDAIISKTLDLLDIELSKKTSDILFAGCPSSTKRIDVEMDTNYDQRSPSIRIDIGKNDQIVMTGCGKKQNPVQISSMLQSVDPETDQNVICSQYSDENGSCYSHSIASTPKKPNIETSVDESTGETVKTIINIPVARLFNDGDPNDSMSDINPLPTTNKPRTNISMSEMTPLPTTNEPRTNISKKSDVNISSNISRMSNELNHTVSPILSQGIKKSRISRLSLKKKLTTDEIANSKVLSSTTSESFINRPPLTCSSFIEKSDNLETCNKDNSGQHETIAVESSMEITAIAAHPPIVRKSFQQIIRKSFKFDNAEIPGNNINKPNMSNAETTIAACESSLAKNTKSKDVCQNDCSANTVATSSSMNKSLDEVSLAERITQKENEKAKKSEKLAEKTLKNSSKALSTKISSLRVNTSLDSVQKSSGKSNNSSEQEGKDVQLQLTRTISNQEKEKSTETKSRQPSNSTVRSSMQVNTSLDSVQKSPNTQAPLDYDKILSMVEERSSIDNPDTSNLQHQSSDADSDSENIPLTERIQNKSASKSKKTVHNKKNSKVIPLEPDESGERNSKGEADEPETSLSTAGASGVDGDNQTQITEKSNKTRNTNSKDENLNILQSNTSEVSRKSRKSKVNSSNRKSINHEGSTVSESSIVEPTPYPASRSLLFKTIIKNNIAMNTLDPRKLSSSSDDEEDDRLRPTLPKKTVSSNKYKSVYTRTRLARSPNQDLMDTVVINSSDESSNELASSKKNVIIDESINDTIDHNKSKPDQSSNSKKHQKSKNSDSSDDEEQNKKVATKRKLYPLRENSQISFSPAEINEQPQEKILKDVKRKKKRKMTQKKQENVEAENQKSAEESDVVENEIIAEKPEKKKKKPRKIKRKNIVVKKVANLTLLDNILDNNEELRPSNDRSSLREFDLRTNRNNAPTESTSKRHKIVIVVTGYEKDDRDLVKNVVKTLGSAVLQANVTPRTTHVISSGVRTINLLKGIIRGCWLLTLEWALKSLESGKWLDPLPYEMSHFAKAVKVNRRDRKLFGKAYVPELFFTCGPMYIENGTIPPASTLKELVKTAGGRVTEDPNNARIIIGLEGLKENWILDSITTGEIQPFDQYKRS